ncbi:hypothetical protein [Actinotalea sp. K2]|uniref:hypothetical protein n=1 Tax=Actinotalea sp. K2 TaxID=2939438 RepID=UPI0020173494|nr:hypothetical protein [Actinotalea sp. K2]MCL3862208.1 hypothetical protein [Actinotalea sp. K2]
MSGSPTDWTSGERVFAPPSGTVDVDWLVPAVLERCDGTHPAQARSALVIAWSAVRDGETPPRHDDLGRVAAEVVEAARRAFRG